jgi:hypothetical protein
MKNSIFYNWTIGRAIRLAAGTGIIIQGIMATDIPLVIIGLIFALIALFNSGCCAGTCSNTASTSASNNKKNSSYEEVV